jgi:HEAT repeat protein
MPHTFRRCALVVPLMVSFAGALRAAEPPADPAGAVKTAREQLARFAQGNPGWKVRMEALVTLARQGPAVTPVLIEGLRSPSPMTREFAAQALVYFVEPDHRPALEQALTDARTGVRIYALQALSLLGPLPRTELHQRLLSSDPSVFGVRPMMSAAMTGGDRPKPADLRAALASYDLSKMNTAVVGELAPDFALADFNGKTTRLSDFRGQPVVLRFILYDF